VRGYRRERELPFAPYQTAIGDPANRNLDSQLMVEGGVSRELSARLTATGRAYLSRYRFRDFLVRASGDGEFTDIGDATWAGAELRGRVALLDRDRLGLTAGGEATLIRTASESYLKVSGAPRTAVETNFDVEGVYAELDGAPLPWLAFTAGLRFDRHSLLEDRFSPRLALFASNAERYGGKLLYSQGFRNPSAFEAFFTDHADFTDNPQIGAETIRSYEAVAWGRPRPGLTTRLSAFVWTASGLVEQEPVIVDGREELQYQNVGTLRSAGLELEASYRDAAGWLGFGGAALTDVTADHADPSKPDVAFGAPAISGTLGVSTPRLGGVVHLSAEVQVIGPRPVRVLPGAAAHDTDTFAGVDLALHAPDLDRLDLTIGVRNLLGRREQIPAAEDFDRSETMLIAVLPGEGREVYARLGYRY
jgi:outer membrane receptor protein involved in Fe transport